MTGAPTERRSAPRCRTRCIDRETESFRKRIPLDQRRVLIRRRTDQNAIAERKPGVRFERACGRSPDANGQGSAAGSLDDEIRDERANQAAADATETPAC